MADSPTRVGLLGGGVIGGGWAARFALNGVDVRVYDPDAQAAHRVNELLAHARRAYSRLTLAPLPREGRVAFVESAAEAVQGAALVQESAPERIELKQQLLAAASRAAEPETLFCSSTSGLRPSLLQAEMEHPERFVVAHPFNPVYLLPLVELCGGSQTAPDTIARAAELYAGVGMRPLVVRYEIDGFLADRLLEAVWRECLWLVHDQIATVEELDDAIRYGAGLRWAMMGTFLTYRIAGGEGGMRHFLAQFGPALQLPWTKLVDVPDLTPELIEALASQSDAQARGRSIAELERVRDDCLVAILQALRAQGVGAGDTLAGWERRLLGRAAARDTASVEIAAPLRLLQAEIPPAWIDYNGHVHESRYLQLFADATDALLRFIGVDADYLAGVGSYYTVETHLSHLGQLFAGQRVEVKTQLLGWDDKRLHIFHALTRDGESAPVATAEQMLVHVDTVAGHASAVGGDVRDRVAGLAGSHSGLPRPPRAGRRIALADGADGRASCSHSVGRLRPT